MATSPESSDTGRLREVFRVFLILGVIGFGGPAAHIAMMRDEVVRKRQWVSDAEFMEYVGITSLIPGPNSTELAIHLGNQRAGRRGLVIAGMSFIIPAVVIVSCLAWLYSEFGTRPEVVDVRYGVLPVIIAIVAHALYGLSRTTFVTSLNILIAVGACSAYVMGVHELLVLVVSGVVVAIWSLRSRFGQQRLSVLIAPIMLQVADPVSRWRLLATFLEIGSVLYGSGYVLLAFLQRHLVDDLGWMTNQQLLDAIAIGQVTPGPVFTTATFIGWQIDGFTGAMISTVGIFAPSFIFVALLQWIVPWVRSHPLAQAFVQGVTTASLGLMAGVFIDLVNDAISDVFTLAIAVVSAIVLVRTRLNSAWLIVLGVAVGAVRIISG